MFAPWGEFVSDGSAPGHGVEIYSRDEELVDTVATFVAAGVAADAAAVLVATRPHLTEIVEELERRGIVDPPLVVADAEETLGRILTGGLEPAAFEEIVGELLDGAETAALGAPRVFGEMVDLLVRRREVDRAMALEELWEELRRKRPFSRFAPTASTSSTTRRSGRRCRRSATPTPTSFRRTTPRASTLRSGRR